MSVQVQSPFSFFVTCFHLSILARTYPDPLPCHIWPWIYRTVLYCQRDTTGILHLSPLHWSLMACHQCTGVVHLSWSGSTVPLGHQHTSCRWQFQVVAHVVCTNDTGKYFWEASKLLQKSFPVIKGDKPVIINHNMRYIVPISWWLLDTVCYILYTNENLDVNIMHDKSAFFHLEQT